MAERIRNQTKLESQRNMLVLEAASLHSGGTGPGVKCMEQGGVSARPAACQLLSGGGTQR